MMGHSHMELMQSAPGFFDLWSPWVFISILAAGVLYLYTVRSAARRREGDGVQVSSKQTFLFLTGLFVCWGATGTPISYYGHSTLFSAHMLQQSMLYLILPPFLYLGTPEWLVRPFFQLAWMKRYVYPLTHPLIAILSFNLLFSIYHMPFVFNAAFQSHFLHTLSHMILLLSAFHMWFPVFCPAAEWKRLSDLQRMAYIFANGVLLTPACALIIFAKSLLYDGYMDAPQVISWLTVHDDQQMGGVIMKIIQEIVYGSVLAYSFFKWYRSERKDEDYPGDPHSPSASSALQLDRLGRA